MAYNPDLVIVDVDGVYKVPQKQWMTAENRVDNDVVGDAAVLVRRGALVADVPEPDIPVGYYCFLINLAQLADAQPVPDQKAGANGDQPIGENGLIIHAPKDAYYILREADWKKNKINEPPSKDDVTTICAERPYGFLVNLPLFRK